MAIVTPIVTKYIFTPLFRKYIEYHFARYDHISNLVLMILVLCAFISIAAYAGTSVLFGAFLAGTFLTYIPSKHPEAPFVVTSREEGEREAHKSPTFVHTFERYLVDVQKYLMEPLFFASVGFAIPFVQLWTGMRIWRGVLFTLLMVFAKVSFPLIDYKLTAHPLTMILSSLLGYGSSFGKHFLTQRAGSNCRAAKRKLNVNNHRTRNRIPTRLPQIPGTTMCPRQGPPRNSLPHSSNCLTNPPAQSGSPASCSALRWSRAGKSAS
jgi:hypothetical protein